MAERSWRLGGGPLWFLPEKLAPWRVRDDPRGRQDKPPGEYIPFSSIQLCVLLIDFVLAAMTFWTENSAQCPLIYVKCSNKMLLL